MPTDPDTQAQTLIRQAYIDKVITYPEAKDLYEMYHEDAEESSPESALESLETDLQDRRDES